MGREFKNGKCVCRIEYSPLPSQARFHESPARFRGFSGPIGSGKSQALCQEAIKMSYINAGRHGLIGAPTYPMLRDATQASLLEVLESNRLPYELNKAEMTLVMKDTGSRILLRSMEEYERLRGTNLAWFGVDELTYTHEAAWLRLEGRLRDPLGKKHSGFAVWTPKGHDWVYKRFLATEIAGYEAIIAKPLENRYILDKIPDFYERLRHSYDDRFFRQEVMGEYLNLDTGRVYQSFTRDQHIKSREVDPTKTLLWALDFNVDPMSSVVAQRDGDRIFVLDEIVLSRASTWDACEEFLNRYPYHSKGVHIYGDASGGNAKTSGLSDVQTLKHFMIQKGYRQAWLKFGRSNPAVRDRIGLVNAKLKNAAGEIHLYISPKCNELIKDFEEVAYKPGSSLIDKDRDPKRTHISDALGYLIWHEFGLPQGLAGEQQKPLLIS